MKKSSHVKSKNTDHATQSMVRFIKSQPISSLFLLLIPATTTLAFVASPHSSNSFALAQPSSSSASAAQPPATALCSSGSSNSQETMPKSSATSPSIPQWYQHDISITAPSRGCHLITSQVNNAIRDDMSNIKIGMANLFIQHTSASLTINENADPDVRR